MSRSESPAPTDTATLIRPARASDAPQLAALLGELGYPAEADAVARRLRALQAGEEAGVLVAATPEGVAALGSLDLYHTIHAERPGALITALVVAAPLRGQGIGRRLLTALEAHARERGCDRIMVTTGNRRDGAHAFYEGCGYEFDGRRYVRGLP